MQFDQNKSKKELEGFKPSPALTLELPPDAVFGLCGFCEADGRDLPLYEGLSESDFFDGDAERFDTESEETFCFFIFLVLD